VRYGYDPGRARAARSLREEPLQGFGRKVAAASWSAPMFLGRYYDALFARAEGATLIARDIKNVIERATCCDAGTPCAPLRSEPDVRPVSMYLNDVFTVTVEPAGLPGISVPAGLTADGLRLGSAAARPSTRRPVLRGRARARESGGLQGRAANMVEIVRTRDQTSSPRRKLLQAPPGPGKSSSHGSPRPGLSKRSLLGRNGIAPNQSQVSPRGRGHARHAAR